MQIRSSDRSVVKAIRQRSLLTEWSRRHVDSRGQLPSLDNFCPAFFEEEKGRQGTAAFYASGSDKLGDFKDVDGRKAGVFGFRRINPRHR